MEEIHLTTLELLCRKSMQVTLPEAVELPKEAGCCVHGDRLEFNNREQKGAFNGQ
jgi:trimethylamine:corrinoid methyltransferase-like protein